MSRARGHRPQRLHGTPARRVAANNMALAMAQAQRLASSDVQMQTAIVQRALREFAQGQHCAHHWRSLADTANMAETLAGMGLGSGPEADAAIHQAQQALAAVHGRQQRSGSYTLHASELQALRLLASLHRVQLQAASYGEFELAFYRTRHRLEQARAGNAGAGVLVVQGELGGGGA